MGTKSSVLILNPEPPMGRSRAREPGHGIRTGICASLHGRRQNLCELEGKSNKVPVEKLGLSA